MKDFSNYTSDIFSCTYKDQTATIPLINEDA